MSIIVEKEIFIEKEVVIAHGSHDWNPVKQNYETDDMSICVEKYYNDNNELIALKLVNYLYGATTNEKADYKEIREQMYKYSKPFSETTACNVYNQGEENIHHLETEVCYYPVADVSIIKEHAHNHQGDWLYMNVCGIYPGMPNQLKTQLYNDRTCEWYNNLYWHDRFQMIKGRIKK